MTLPEAWAPAQSGLLHRAAAWGGRGVARLVGVEGEVDLGPPPARRGLGWAPALTLLAAVCVLACGFAANASRAGFPFAIPVVHAACALFLAPLSARLIHPTASRQERIVLVLAATAALFAIKLVRAPLYFVDHDEFLHWVTTEDILARHRLFTPNPLLPVSPLYPGLELATVATASLSGLAAFPSAVIVLAMARLAFVSAFFLACERITDSARVASIACIVYMGSSTFLVFDAHFSYESLAVVFLAAVWLAEAKAARDVARAPWISGVLTLPLLAALAVTHHTTAAFAAALLCAATIIEHGLGRSRGFELRLVLVATVSLLLPLAWSRFMGNPTIGYLGPVLEGGMRELSRLIAFAPGRKLFVSDDGDVAPIWAKLTTFAAVIVLCLGLAIGFFRALRLRMPGVIGRLRLADSRLIVLTALTLAYPVSVLFRFTKSGWEIGNRLGSLSFFGVALIIAIGVAAFWQSSSRSAWRATALGLAAALVVVGGVISGEGPRLLVPARFKVSADSASVEPMGISAATWTCEWLGPGNTFVADRVNRLLLATYGRQDVTTTLNDFRDASIAVLSKTLGNAERSVLSQLGVRFLMIDLRLTTGLPVVGVYFDGADGDRSYAAPPEPKALLKFNDEPNVSRVFDNGYLIIYDVSRIADAR